MSVNNKQKNQPNALIICFGGFSCTGIKAENQDAFSAANPLHHQDKTKGVVALIADGVSSANKAKDAAQLAVTQFIHDYYATAETWSTQKSAGKVITSLNDWMFAQSDSYATCDQQWLTTLSVLIMKSTTGHIFQIGDTRISQYRNNKLSTLTAAHNRKQIGKNTLLTRALGADNRLKVDTLQIALCLGDIYLLCCDGFYEFVADVEITNALSTLSNSPTQKQLEQISHQLVNLALSNGSKDNVSCLMVHIVSLPASNPDELERQLLSRQFLPALEVGMKIDDFTVIKKLYASSRSHLYLVQKQHHSLPLVLKVPSLNFSDDVTYLQGFVREAWLGKQLNHPHILKILPANEGSHYLYHYCEYINGQTLSEWSFDNPKPDIAQVRGIIKQLITALRVLQRLDIVHRDLKPENIMIDPFGQVTLIDYGNAQVASLTENADTMIELWPQGALNYVAPETLLTNKVSNISDLFSLGVISYQLLTGEYPFKPMSQYQALNVKKQYWQYRSIKQYRPELPLWLDYALKKATEANPGLRYQAYSEFEADISKPNISAVNAFYSQPILVRDPILFWQGTTVVCIILLIISWSF